MRIVNVPIPIFNGSYTTRKIFPTTFHENRGEYENGIVGGVTIVGGFTQNGSLTRREIATVFGLKPI